MQPLTPVSVSTANREYIARVY